MARNIHKVPKKQWKKWGPSGQAAFNRVWSAMLDQEQVNSHPETTSLSWKAWKTLRWNTAWLVADAYYSEDV